MPAYAYVEADLTCPHCGRGVTDLLWFQWGYCAGYAKRPESTYAVGDPIRWRRTPDGYIPTWTSFRAGGEHKGSNLGDPAVRDLVLRDSAQYWLLDPCPHCGGSLGGGALEIRDGVICRAWLLRPSELAPGVDTFVRARSGALHPRPDWNDSPLRLLDLPPEQDPGAGGVEPG